MEKYTLVKLSNDDETWLNFERNWQEQCHSFDEDFDTYAEATFSAVRDLIKSPVSNAGAFSLKNEQKYDLMCQLNKANLPGYAGPVLRVRFITMSPEFDFSDKEVSDYAEVLVELLFAVLSLAKSDGDLKSEHVKFHLRSPTERQFFAALRRNLADNKLFSSIEFRGTWLYISL